MSDAVARVRAYLVARDAVPGRRSDPAKSLDRVFDGGMPVDLTLGDLREVLELAEIYEDLCDS